MPPSLPFNEPLIRIAAFVGIVTVVAAWELVAPRRPLAHPKWLRWSGNFGVVVIATIALRLLFPIAAVGTALFAQEHEWGLLNLTAWPGWLEFLIAVVALDLAIYLQHVLFHAVPALWRVHRMHHADLDFDFSTGVRFHPVEILLSMAIKMGVVLALGPPALAVLTFEILLNATSVFNHGNVRMPAAFDRVLRWFVITPEMHRVHHSIHPFETNSNFGFNLPWWDRIFGTYRDQPKDGHEGMTIGIDQFRSERDLRLDRILVQPLLTRSIGRWSDERRAAQGVTSGRRRLDDR